MSFRSPTQKGITPQHRGRYPGFDVLSQVEVWDDVTAGAVLSRLSHPTGLAFFTPREVGVARPLLDLLLAQDGEPRVPVLEMIDERLALGETDGWHYDDLPEDGEAWRVSLAALDAEARDRFGCGFGELSPGRGAALVQAVHDTDGSWRGLHAGHLWSLWTRYACTAFYSHPWAWNEIGFPGPAYPRGYLNPGLNAREKWEVTDRDGTDPVEVAGRLEQAHKEHARLLGEEPA
ncbi:MAG: gluconate 2-dehydrogenase subunit 3 family protein [Geodermatophilales bacterium]|nr:gluconate 2-dehydrogenase subunit 3 family protein [Geodermatophilales bacterium]